MRKYLVDGVSQSAVDCNLPVVSVHRSFSLFLSDCLDGITGNPGDCLRLVAHPPDPSDGETAPIHLRAHQLFTDAELREGKRRRIVLAMGPEGGWTAKEVEAFIGRGFQTLSLGRRVLRVDVAVSLMLGMANEWADLQSPSL